MDSKVIAVEGNLHQIGEYLRGKGLKTVSTSDANIQRAAAVVISGADKDVLGIETAATKAPIINAAGMTPDEVWQAINSYAR